MKERPILFNGEMVRAILDGRKMQTRRVISNHTLDMFDVAASIGECYSLRDSDEISPNSLGYYLEFCPLGQHSDRLWVREAWQHVYMSTNEYGHVDSVDFETHIPKIKPSHGGTVYQADGHEKDREDRGWPWRPSLHMPRWASRIDLLITGVRIERLQSISQEDARAEGFGVAGWVPSYSNPDNAGFDETLTPYDNFADTWESIYGQRSWLANPWVWVIEFQHIK